tara:strand:- start:31 stop:1356 length:1326 start_codon:yes stop_codon:yes gene_type:complete
MKTFRKERIDGWGYHNKSLKKIFRPERIKDLTELFLREDEAFLARGSGTSYGDASINSDGINIDTTRLNKMLQFDSKNGILHCQSGVTLHDIVKTFHERGWFLNVTPGTQLASVGGCVACDSNGKNWKGGSFCNYIKGLNLMLHNGNIVYCDDQHDPDLFYATCGGMGMTGVILDVYLVLKKISSSYIDVETIKFRTLRELFDLLLESMESHEYIFSWLDSHEEGKNLGRGLLQRANHCNNGELVYREDKKIPIWFNLPGIMINKYVVEGFNNVYYHLSKEINRQKSHIKGFFYPLDNFSNWNRIYGRKGFIQYQVAIPTNDAYAVISELFKIITKTKLASVITCIKPLIKSMGLISFPIDGFTLAIDFAHNQKVFYLLDRLDEIVVSCGGRVYLAKDIRLNSRNFRMMYSDSLEQWNSVREKYNVKNKFSSSMFKRFNGN